MSRKNPQPTPTPAPKKATLHLKFKSGAFELYTVEEHGENGITRSDVSLCVREEIDGRELRTLAVVKMPGSFYVFLDGRFYREADTATDALAIFHNFSSALHAEASRVFESRGTGATVEEAE